MKALKHHRLANITSIKRKFVHVEDEFTFSIRDWLKSIGVVVVEQRGGGSSVFEPLLW